MSLQTAARLAGRAMLLLTAATQHAAAARIELPIEPASTRIDYTVFALGFFPVPASFLRFHGTLSADPTDLDACDVHVVVDVASLHMADAKDASMALGTTMLDAARYPAMTFDGRCASGGVTGALTLHGVTLPLRLAKRREGDIVVSTGTLHRRDFGILGMQALVGQQISIRFTTHLPPVLTRARSG